MAYWDENLLQGPPPHELTAGVWSPLVAWTRRRHLAFRARLAQHPGPAGPGPAPAPAGV